MAGELASFASGGDAAKTSGGELATIMERLATATVDATGKLRDAGGRFVSMADQAKAAASATGAAAEALAKVAPQAERAGTVMKTSGAAGGVFSGAMGKVSSGAKSVASAITGLGSSFMSLATGPIPSATSAGKMLGKEMAGAMTEGAHKLAGALAQLGPEGAVAGAAIEAVTAVLAATVGTLLTVAGLAVDVAQKVGMVTARFAALAGTAAGGKAVQAMLSHLNLPFASSQVSSWAQSLLAAGIKGQQLERDIKAVAAASALMGQEGGAAAEAMFKRLGEGGPAADKLLADITKGGRRSDAMLKEMGLSLADIGGKAAVSKMKANELHDALAKAMAAKGAGPLAAMQNTLPVILTKAQEGLRSLFSGLDKPVDRFMGSVRSMFAMFNKGGPMVAILKPIVTSVFGTLFSWATRAVSFVHDAFQQIVIAGLKVRIAIQPIVVAFRQLYGEVVKAIAATGLFQGKSAAMAAVMNFVKNAIVGALTFAVYAVAGFVRVLAAMVGFVGGAIGKVRAVFSGFSLPSLAGAAANMITSFISGISSKIGSVVAAMMGMGAAAKKGLLGALGIASPSRVALEAAGNVTGTFAGEVNDGKPAAQKAFSGLVTPPPGGAGGSGAGSGGAGGPLAALLDRIATALEASPGVREVVQQALLEASQEGAL